MLKTLPCFFLLAVTAAAQRPELSQLGRLRGQELFHLGLVDRSGSGRKLAAVAFGSVLPSKVPLFGGQWCVGSPLFVPMVAQNTTSPFGERWRFDAVFPPVLSSSTFGVQAVLAAPTSPYGFTISNGRVITTRPGSAPTVDRYLVASQFGARPQQFGVWRVNPRRATATRIYNSGNFGEPTFVVGADINTARTHMVISYAQRNVRRPALIVDLANGSTVSVAANGRQVGFARFFPGRMDRVLTLESRTSGTAAFRVYDLRGAVVRTFSIAAAAVHHGWTASSAPLSTGRHILSVHTQTPPPGDQPVLQTFFADPTSQSVTALRSTAVAGQARNFVGLYSLPGPFVMAVTTPRAPGITALRVLNTLSGTASASRAALVGVPKLEAVDPSGGWFAVRESLSRRLDLFDARTPYSTPGGSVRYQRSMTVGTTDGVLGIGGSQLVFSDTTTTQSFQRASWSGTGGGGTTFTQASIQSVGTPMLRLESRINRTALRIDSNWVLVANGSGLLAVDLTTLTVVPMQQHAYGSVNALL